jgi:hypothetical protein
MTTDVTIRNEGSLIGFTMHTAEARKWFDANVASQGYQWLGSTLWVDHRYAYQIADGLAQDGLIGRGEAKRIHVLLKGRH